MKTWIIVAVVAMLVIAGLVAVNALTNDSSSGSEAEQIKCSSCGSSCTAEKNCGLASCSAVNGASCGCGK